LSNLEAWTKPEELKPEPVTPVVKKAKPVKKSVSKAKPVAKPEKPAKKPAVKKGKHLDASTIEDDGLPTLNKVLEAYAKTSGPRGKVGEIN
jgi:hypothetical protein